MVIAVRINEQHKSIGACEFTLPNFCVLTGKNGSGKSHLLEAMEWNKPKFFNKHGLSTSKQISTVHVDGNECDTVRLIGFGQLNPTITEQCNPNEIIDFVKQTYERLQQDYNILLYEDYATDQQAAFIKYASRMRNGQDLTISYGIS
jgi:predicted ATP-binding protein involved in virulence